MLLPSYFIWFLGYGMIIIGNKIGYAIEILGAILSYLVLIRLTCLLKNKRIMFVLIIALTLFYLFDIITNAFFLTKIYFR